MAETKQTPYRVLIVDDEADERDLLADLLRSPNRSVEVCESAEEALEFIQQNPVDLAFLDHRMPGMSGLQLAEKIKKLHPHTHIIICTGYLVEAGCPEVRERAERVLHKPLNLGEVLDLANSYIEK
jgi:two-component system response regulator AtoC